MRIVAKCAANAHGGESGNGAANARDSEPGERWIAGSPAAFLPEARKWLDNSP